ncbi:hypothetical protein FOQG_19558 [Fusarium oxysporum f. sp. raphani 54005]|uniref:Uncharacterized protein n=1 Tax=Fusarium oxysporum f. sp. raphani 54005 TaxID=1089458 RepID=X0B1T0_FUSOX|nr:hypothetical protein FOQG_19558 [Fusarium oxysporum f. sp. raphani 54005]
MRDFLVINAQTEAIARESLAAPVIIHRTGYVTRQSCWDPG